MSDFTEKLLAMSNDNLIRPPFKCGAKHPEPSTLDRATAANLPVPIGSDLTVICEAGVVKITDERSGVVFTLSPAQHYLLHQYVALVHNAGLYD